MIWELGAQISQLPGSIETPEFSCKKMSINITLNMGQMNNIFEQSDHSINISSYYSQNTQEKNSYTRTTCTLMLDEMI